MKRTLLVVIDALATRIVKPAIEAGKLPTFKQLIERGAMRDECITIFPSITPAATASIITGTYPSEHGVAGAYFYDTDDDKVYYFGTDFWAVQRQSFSTYFQDFLLSLNDRVLCADTLFQTAESCGLQAGCINYMIYRGNRKHTVDMPWLMKLWPGIPFSSEISGPALLYEGDFVADAIGADVERLAGDGGMLRRFGFQDETTAQILNTIAKADAWPDFTLAYFPDNDFDSHDQGPAAALATVQKVDTKLAELFEICGGIDKFLETHAILIVGDHSQSDLIADRDACGIDIDKTLPDCDIVAAGADWTDTSQLMACPNMRACQFYLRRGHQTERSQIVNQLLSDPRVDQVIWREPRLNSTESAFVVATADRGELLFSRVTDASHSRHHHARDDFGNTWEVSGDLSAVDASVEQGHIAYRDYPNALERIATSFHVPTSGDLWATARPGHEFKLADTKLNEAGSHGSLHALDSLAPLIVAGLPTGVEVPEKVRTVDIVPLCEKILGMDRSTQQRSNRCA